MAIPCGMMTNFFGLKKYFDLEKTGTAKTPEEFAYTEPLWNQTHPDEIIAFLDECRRGDGSFKNLSEDDKQVLLNTMNYFDNQSQILINETVKRDWRLREEGERKPGYVR